MKLEFPAQPPPDLTIFEVLESRVGALSNTTPRRETARAGQRPACAQKMFIGEYTHTVDEKKRISLPSKFRKELGAKIIVTKSPDACLIVYPQKTWEKIASRLGDLPMGHRDNRDFSRFMLGGAVEVEVDSIGRILIPDFLRDFAGLKSKVVFAGLFDKIEVWNEKEWGEKRKLIERQADSMAEKLGGMGVI